MMMKKIPLKKLLPPLSVTAVVLTSLLLSACNDDRKESKKKDPPNRLTGLAEYQGAWIQEGEALALNIDGETITGYNYSRETCVVVSDINHIPHAQAEQRFTQLSADVNNTQLTFILEGQTEDDRLRFSSATLPSACNNAQPPTTDPARFDPEFVFEHAWHIFNDYYPFFQRRGVDWQEKWDNFRPKVTAETTQNELFELMSDMLANLNDGHVSLFAESETLDEPLLFSPGLGSGWANNTIAAANEFDLSEEEANNSMLMQVMENIQNHYGLSSLSAIRDTTTTSQKEGELRISNDRELPMVWGKLTGNIAYLNIFGLAIEPSTVEDIPLDQQLETVAQQMHTILDDIADTEALIIDVRFNGGGADKIALTIANYFADKRRVAASKENYNIGNPTPRKILYIEPYADSSLNYTKPIQLITGPDTASAAEIFTMAMTELPHVTHIGETTEGILSDVLVVELGSGWQLGLSNQVYYTADERVLETEGVSPSTTIPVTSISGSFFFGAQPAIHYALEQL